MARVFRQFDALICPISPTAAFARDHGPDQEARPHLDLFHWPDVATLPGPPSTATAIARTAEGLPIGARIVGPWIEDRTSLELARLIEREFGGFAPPPALI